MLSVAFISNVYIADSLRARTLINLSAVLYEQAAAQTSLSAKVDNIDLNFVPSVTFISNVYIADSLRVRTLINLSAVLYKQAAARTGLSAKVSNISSISLSAKVSIIDLNFVPSVAFDAIENVELIGNLLGNADRVNNNNNNLVRDNIEELICVSKVKNNRNNLNIMVTNSTSREFSRVDMKSLTELCLLIDRAKAYNISKFYKGKNIQLLRPQGLIPGELGSIYVLRSVNKIRANVANVFNIVISKLDKVPTQELSSYIKTELLRDNSRKFYRLIITSEDTHYKQIIKKAYIMLLERALLILFMT
ncbi:hypothetical protein HBI55_232850 [Parastagonospora nodorum]|nr:hypothetical protein HBI55_232850 [Parastagonospora nodorum]